MFRIIVFVVVVVAGYFVYDTYGYRYVLRDVVGNADGGMMVGSSDPDINIVTYVDYGGVASRRFYPILLNLLSSDSNVRIIVKPIETDTGISRLSTRVALAAKQQNRFMNVNNVFLTTSSDIDERYVEGAVRSLGINYNRLRFDALSPEVEAEAKNLQAEAALLNISSYPTTYVGHVKLEGASHSLSDIRNILKDLRSGRR